KDRALAEVSCRAINDWAANAYASKAPKELYIVATLPGHFPDAAAAELRRVVEQYGFVAGTLRPNQTSDGRELSDKSYEVLWSTAEELGVPICTHNFADNAGLPQMGGDRARTWAVKHAGAHSFEAMMAFASLYEEHVFDRHPGLRVAFMEAACGWAPFW